MWPGKKPNNLGVWTEFSEPIGYRTAMLMMLVGWQGLDIPVGSDEEPCANPAIPRELLFLDS
jgi:hypothetical protein